MTDVITPFLARPARFERTAFRLGGGCSILLSYGRKSTRYSSMISTLPQFVKVLPHFGIENGGGACYDKYIPF